MHLNWSFPLLICKPEKTEGIAAFQSPLHEGLCFSETFLHPQEGLGRLSLCSASCRK